MESLVLDRWNGRPSVWMSTSANGDPYLHWMVVGHNEDFDIWVHVHLTWATADAISAQPPLRLADALTLAPDAPLRIVLSEDGRPIMYADTAVPSEPRDDVVADVMAPFVEAMERAVRDHDTDEVLIKTATRDLTELLSVRWA